jgi:hypothetical protein
VVPLTQRPACDRRSHTSAAGPLDPDLEHRRTVACFFLALIERSLARPGEGLYRWLGEQQAQQGTGASVRPDGYGRYLLPDGEVTFYLEADRATEPPPGG